MGDVSSEKAVVLQCGGGLKQQGLAVDACSVQQGEGVQGAEHGVCQSETQRGGDDAPAILHHPGP